MLGFVPVEYGESDETGVRIGKDSDD